MARCQTIPVLLTALYLSITYAVDTRQHSGTSARHGGPGSGPSSYKFRGSDTIRHQRSLLQPQQTRVSGGVLAWGDLTRVGTPPISTRNGIRKICGGSGFAMALTVNDELVVWGSKYVDPASVPADVLAGPVKDIACGIYHSLVLLSNNSVFAYGRGDGNLTDVPVELRNGEHPVKQVAAGMSYSLALLVNGTVMAWDLDGWADIALPATARSGVVAITGGIEMAIAQLANGSFLTGLSLNDPPPIVTRRPQDVAAIVQGFHTFVALLKNGSLETWLWDTPDDTDFIRQVSTPPPILPGQDAAVLVSSGWNFSCAVINHKQMPTVQCWGMDGLPGLNVPSYLKFVPAAFDIKDIVAADGYGMVLVAGGILSAQQDAQPGPFQAGYPASGQAGHLVMWGAIDKLNLSIAQLFDGHLTKVSAGRDHVMAVDPSGKLVSLVRGTSYAAVDTRTQNKNIIDVSCGWQHTLVLFGDGSVLVWGSNDLHQLDMPVELGPGGTWTAKAIAAGAHHSLALLQNGTVVAWGDDSAKACSVPDEAKQNIVSIAAGAMTSFAIHANGSLIQWGAVSALPIAAQQQPILQVAGGLDHCVALLKNGSVIAWPVSLPQYPEALRHVLATPTTGRALAVTAGSNYSCALMETGEVECWGAGFSIPKEYASQNPLSVPTPALGGIVQLAGGGSFMIAVVADLPLPTGASGPVLGWGAAPPGPPTVPVLRVSTGDHHAMALLPNGSVQVWGNTANPQQLSVGFLDNQLVVDIAAGTDFCLALLRNGTVVSWGDRALHVPVGLAKAKATVIASGYSHALALLSDGSVIAWGKQTLSGGALSVPMEMQGKVTAIAAGSSTSYALVKNSTAPNTTVLVAWGQSETIPIDVAAQVVAVSAGSHHTLAVLQNGSAVAWLSGSAAANPTQADQQLIKVPAAARRNVVAVSAGSYHSVALLASGHVVTWGAAGSSVLTVPSELSAYKLSSVAAGLNYTLAILENAWPDKLNEATGCNASSSQWGYSCNRAVTDLPGEWQLHYTISRSSSPPNNYCTAGLNITSNQQLPSDATHWVHFLVSSTSTGWIAMSYPDVLGHMYPAKAILGYVDANGGSIHTYQLTEHALPAPDMISWASNMAAATSTDDRMTLCFTQPIKLPASFYSSNSSTSSSSSNKRSHRRSMQASSSFVADFSQGLRIHLASSPTHSSIQKHTVVGTLAVEALSGAQSIQVIEAGPASVGTAGSDTYDGGSQSPGNQSSSKVHSGAIVGIAVGAAVALILAGAVTGWYVRQRTRQSQHGLFARVQGKTPAAYQHAQPWEDSYSQKNLQAPAIPGLLEGDGFLRATALRYGWKKGTDLPGPLQAVEAGVNDIQLDALIQQQQSTGSGTNTPPVVQLSTKELRDSVQLLSDGLLGQGATALVFKCVWPSRFGPSALLAAKVVKDGFDADMHTLESFTYEVNVLESIRHPNIVRLYGYCLEPPTLCLILELLPTSLKDVLYKGISLPGSTGSMCTRSVLTDTSHGCTSAEQPHETKTGHSSSCISITPASNSHAHHSNTMGYHGKGYKDPKSQGIGLSTFDACSSSDATALPAVSDPDIPSQPGSGQGTERGAQLVQQHVPKASCAMQQQLTNMQVVQVATDVACGLAHLHNSAAPQVAPNCILAAAVASESTAADNASEAMDGTDLLPSTRGRVVHRDMKPANILINSKGVAKISDFGLARQHEHTTVATVHLGVGTLPYMAPELLVGAHTGPYGQAVTNRVDIYSLAMMMWEMLSGCPPWKDMGEMSILAAVSQKQRPPLPDAIDAPAALQEVANQPASPTAIPQLNKLIRACWNQRDLKRPQATEVHQQLAHLRQLMQLTTGGSNFTASKHLPDISSGSALIP